MSSRRTSRKSRPTDPGFWTVENELPDPPPVSKAEVDAVERYFGDVLDEVFNPKPLSSGQATELYKGKRQ
jgi:hypothetical protein